MGNGDRKAKPTEADRLAAGRLRAAWDRKKGALGLTQDKMAEALGGTQGLVSQYLNGKIPLNYKALTAFAAKLEIDPLSIRDDLPEQRIVQDARGLVSQPARLTPEIIVRTATALLVVLRRRDPDAELDLRERVDAELFADVYGLATSTDDDVSLGASVADLVLEWEVRRGRKDKQAGGTDRSQAGGPGARKKAAVAAGRV